MTTKGEILEAMKEVQDPEIGMNIVDLGLVYRVEQKEDHVEIDFTLTTPGCPAGEYIQQQIVEKIEEAAGLPAEANLVWSPPWGPD